MGIDSSTGTGLFPPVPLDSGVRPPRCLINGPLSVVCVSRETENVTAWVIDAESGIVRFTGPTDLRTAPAILVVQQVGIYAVAETQDQGVYGIGATAETTWFVPGDGSVDQKYSTARDFSPNALATQTISGVGSEGKVVFSPADGKVIAPETMPGAEQQQTVVYPGGFAAVIEFDETRRGVQFFDDTGRRAGQEDVKGLLNTNGGDLPMIDQTSGGWALYTSTGGEVLQEPGKMPQESRLIGNTFYVKDPEQNTVRRWQQYDLQTGIPGPECGYDLGAGYVGTDGHVGVFQSGNPNVGLVTRGIDLTSCDERWSIKSPVGSFRDVWRINTALVQLSDDGTELTSLVAPR